MNTLRTIFAALFLLGVTAPVFADEVGPGKPENNTQSMTTSSTTTADTAEECSLLDYFLGLCDEE